MAFHVGQKAQRVERNQLRDYFTGEVGDGPGYGETAVIRCIKPHWSGLTALFFVGWPNDSTGYDSRDWQPVVERPTSIAIFTAMLTPKKTRVDA